jgi:hypothetical protein
VDSVKAAVGAKWSVSVPTPCQLPSKAGVIVGSEEPGATGAENVIVMSGTPLIPVAPLAGVADRSWSGATEGCADALAPGLAAAAAGCGPRVNATQTPAASTSTITAVTAAIRPRALVSVDTEVSLKPVPRAADGGRSPKGSLPNAQGTRASDFRWRA